MMTRKDYARIAAALAASHPVPLDPLYIPHMIQWNLTREDIIIALQADNPAFDANRFRKATEAK